MYQPFHKLRVRFAELEMKQGEVAKRANMAESTLTARMTGRLPWKGDEIAAVAKVLGMLCHPLACTAPVKLSSAVLHDNPPGVSGWLVEGRYNYGAFVTDNKKKGIYYQATT